MLHCHNLSHEDHDTVVGDLWTVVAQIGSGLGIDPTTVIPLIRALRASVHGFVHLELRGGFGLPDDIDDSFTTTSNLVIEAIATQSTSRNSSQASGRATTEPRPPAFT